LELKRIISKAKSLYNKYKTRDPFELADALGIHLSFSGNFSDLRGMYTIIKQNRFIILSDKLDEAAKRIVTAHEIGHDRLHRDIAKISAMHEFSLYKMDCRPEFEANVFAAELLIGSDELLELIYDGHDIHEAATILDTDPNLIAIKVSNLIKGGYALNPPEYNPKFLNN
jgi:Zn-dependent peptidase ImmA (M78 family)